jgi:SAM-dependent methyltransferase
MQLHNNQCAVAMPAAILCDLLRLAIFAVWVFGPGGTAGVAAAEADVSFATGFASRTQMSCANGFVQYQLKTVRGEYEYEVTEEEVVVLPSGPFQLPAEEDPALKLTMAERLGQDDNYHNWVQKVLAATGLGERTPQQIGALPGASGQPGRENDKFKKCIDRSRNLTSDSRVAAAAWAMQVPVTFLAECHHQYYGGSWSKSGEWLSILKESGVKSTDTVFDVGCGSLRLGVSLMRYLSPGNYYGLDIDELSLRAGIQWEVPVNNLTNAEPHLLLSGEFEMSKIAAPSSIDWVVFFMVLKNNGFFMPALMGAAKVLKPNGRILIVGSGVEKRYSKALQRALTAANLSVVHGQDGHGRLYIAHN